MIKTLIFDFGDVFINLDKSATTAQISGLGLENISEEMLAFNKRYEVGDLNTSSFLDYYKSLLPHVGTDELAKVWNAIILDFPEHRLEFIETLAIENQYQLILLSNTNELHIEKVIENMGIDRYDRFKKSFEQFYLSHEIHLRKPNKDIYTFVLENNQLIAEECLFIDDTKENTDAAKELGIHVWNHNPLKEDIVHLFTSNQHLFK